MMPLAAFAALAAAGAISTGVVLRAFARFSDPAKIATAKRQIKASLYEMRLFLDEPAVLLRAQKRLFGANLLYLSQMIVPLLIVLAPMCLLMSLLDNVYGYRPLHPGEAAMVTVYASGAVDLRTAEPVLESVPGIAVETSGVRIRAERRVCWRIRPDRAGLGTLRAIVNGAVYEKSVVTGAGFMLISRQRVRSLLNWVLCPTEVRLPRGPVDRIEIAYPSTSFTALGLTLPWIAWFFLAGLIGAIWLR